MECPHCGARVPRRARACPECGSDDRTGWSSPDDQEYEETDLPDAYDPDRWEREAEEREVAGKRRIAVVVAIIAALVLVLIAVARGIAMVLRA